MGIDFCERVGRGVKLLLLIIKNIFIRICQGKPVGIVLLGGFATAMKLYLPILRPKVKTSFLIEDIGACVGYVHV